jgi:hypothetical protein
MNKKLSFSERLHNAVASQTVEEYKARHAYLHGVGYSREEWDYMWMKSKNTTWAHQFGRMVGYEEVYYNSVGHMDSMCARSYSETIKKFPQYMGHDIRSSGSSGVHVLASDVIEVAEDGKSARASYLTPGTLTGPVGFDNVHRGGVWLWERYGSEFVYVNGKWQWFHEQVCPDLAGDYDAGNWAHNRYIDFIESDCTVGELGGRPAKLTEPGLFHSDYTVVQTVQNTVPAPKPYKTLKDVPDEESYSPGRWDPTDQVLIKVEKEAVGNLDAEMADNPFGKIREE